MRESAAFVCDVWCDTFEMFPLRLQFGSSIHFNPIFFVVLHHTAPNTLLVVEQEIVLSAAVGHRLLGLDTNVRISKKAAPFSFQ